MKNTNTVPQKVKTMREDFQVTIAVQTFLSKVDSVQTEVMCWLSGSNMDQLWIEFWPFVGDMETSRC